MKCTEGKGAYPTEQAADAAITFLRDEAPKDRRREIVHLRPYRCRKCKQWHLTSNTGAEF